MNNFSDVMSKKTDDELVTLLLVKHDEYTEEALKAAQAEFDKREIDPARIETVKAEQSVLREQALLRANEPLERDVKILAIIFPLIARLMHAKNFRDGGYDRKLEEMTNAYFYGRLILIGIIVLIVVISKIV